MDIPHRADSYHLFGNLLTFRVRPGDTGDVFAVFECRSLPGAGAPPNRHREDETFMVLEGTVGFQIEGETRVHGAGDVVRIPNNALHAFTNVGETPSRMLIFNWPGHAHERFFSEAGTAFEAGDGAIPAPDGPPDVAALVAIGARCGLEFLPGDGGR